MTFLMAMVMAIKFLFVFQPNLYLKLSLKYVLLILGFISPLYAATSIDTTRSVTLSQSFGSDSSNDDDSSISISTVRPTFKIDYNKQKINLTADYSLIASHNHTENDSDITHTLDLRSSYTHIPNEWISNYTSRILLKNISDIGKLENNKFAPTEASKSYLVNTIDTSRQLKVSQHTLFNSKASFTSQGFKNESYDNSAAFELGLNFQQLSPSISLNTSIASNINEANDTTNNVVTIASNYRINSHFSSTLSIVSFSDNQDNFNEEKYSLGLNWILSQNSFIRFDVGRIGNEDTWSVDSSVTLKRSSITLKHTEIVRSTNLILLENLDEELLTFSDNTINNLAFVKNTTLRLGHKTRRTTYTFSLGNVKEFSKIDLTPDRTTESINLDINYQLNNLHDVSYSFTKNKIKTTINNQLKEHSVNWSSKLTQNSNYNISIDFAEQNSDSSEFEYTKKQINFNYTLIF